MHKNNNLNQTEIIGQYEKVLHVFADYLEQQNNIDFVYSEKYGWLYISSWSLPNDSAYDVIRIDSIERLCEVLADVLVYNYLAIMEEICLNTEDIEILYHEHLERYMEQLPDYQKVFKDKFVKALVPVVCKESESVFK